MFGLPPVPGNQAVVPKKYNSGSTLTVPVNFLVELHNLAPVEHEVRQRIQEYFSAFGEANEKAHWARSLVVQDNCDLQVDDSLLDIAIYRGKQETYIKNAQEQFENLQSALSSIARFQEHEIQAVNILDSEELKGTPLVPIRDLSEIAKNLQAGSQALKITVEKMRLGMAESLAPSAPPADRIIGKNRMRALFAIFGKRSQVPAGFHDYRQEELAQAFGIDGTQAAEVLHDFHALLNGRPQFTQGIGARDLHALTKATSVRFGCDQREAVAIARWFGALVQLIQDCSVASHLKITEKTRMSVCQHGAPVGYSHHVDYEGKRFDAQTGLRTDQEYLLPEALIGCKCSARSIIPGFEDN